jgi:hypothetical protein
MEEEREHTKSKGGRPEKSSEKKLNYAYQRIFRLLSLMTRVFQKS